MTADKKVLSLRERQKKQVSEDIFLAAQELFVSKGYEETTVKEITDAAGISRASFFNYYSGKPAILKSMIDDMNTRFYQLIQEQRSNDSNTSEKLTSFIDYSCHVIEKTSAFSRVLFTSFWMETSNSSDQQFAHQKLNESFFGLLQDGVKRGEVRTDISLEVLSQMVAAAFFSLTNHWMLDDEYPLVDRSREVAKYISDSISPKS